MTLYLKYILKNKLQRFTAFYYNCIKSRDFQSFSIFMQANTPETESDFVTNFSIDDVGIYDRLGGATHKETAGQLVH